MPDWRAEIRRRVHLDVPSEREAEAVEELAQHLADRYREARARGQSDRDARTAALAELEPIGKAAPRRPPRPRGKTSARIEELWRDARHGLRLMGRAPGFSAIAVLTLALAIGANTVVFSLVSAVLLRPIPLPESSRLIVVTESVPSLGFPVLPFSAPDYLDYAGLQRSFEAIGAYRVSEHDVSGGAQAERVRSAAVTASLFHVLGVAPAIGRTFTDDEDRPGSKVVVLSHGLWQRRFGGAATAVGSTLLLDREPYTVVGVMPAGFQFPLRGPRVNGESAEVWEPAAWTAEQREERGSECNYTAIGRLRPGATAQSAAAEATAVMLRIEQGYPQVAQRFLRGGHIGASAVPLREEIVGRARAPLLVLLAAVALVLLVACANVANLLLARGAARQRELALRAALGADRWRLVRQSAAESLALALVGGGVGLALSAVLRRAALAVAPIELPLVERAGLDGRVLAVTLIVSIASALLFGIAPGLAAAQGPLTATLRHDARAGTSKGLKRVLRGFAVAQFAGALVLLTAAGLLLRSFQTLTATDPGFQPRQAAALSVSLPARTYATRVDILSFEERLLQRLGAQPGVEAAGASTDLPFAPSERRTIVVGGGGGDKTMPPVTTQSWVLGDYFRAAGIPLRAGRRFEPRDTEGAPRVVIVSETLARRFWPGQDAIGKRLKFGAETAPWLEVVGVVGDVKDGRLEEAANPHTYTPLSQEKPNEVEAFLRSINVVVRSRGESSWLLGGIRHEMAALDPGLAVAGLRLLDQDMSQAVAPQRFQATLVGGFAVLALLLAAVGVYGILAHFVGQQTREIGVRMALGARAQDVVRAVVMDGLRLAAIGVAVGLGLSLAVARLLRGLLFGVGAYDPAAFLAAPALLALVALTACAVPALRAARVDPTVALRQD